MSDYYDDDPPRGFAEQSIMSARAVKRQQAFNKAAGRRAPAAAPVGHAILRESDGLIDTALRWENQPVPVREWFVPGMIPMNAVTMLTGDGGKGKSHLAIQLMIASALDMNWIGKRVAHMPSLGIHCEDDAAELQRRMVDIVGAYGMQLADIRGLVHPVTRVGKDNYLFEAERFDEVGRTTHFYNQVRHTAMHLGVRLVIIDGLHDVFGGNENSRPLAKAFINALNQIALDINGAVLLLAHPSMSGMSSGSGTAGSTAWHNSVRSRLYLHHRDAKPGERGNKDGEVLVLTPMKSNYGPPVDEIAIERRHGRFEELTVDRGPVFDGTAMGME